MRADPTGGTNGRGRFSGNAGPGHAADAGRVVAAAVAVRRAAVTAVRHIPVVRDLAGRLTPAGEPFTVRTVAAMHRPATLPNVVARDGPTCHPLEATQPA